ncbi:MAG TPA: hypothetical protein VF646_06610, partial [Cytophagales bacterium]
VSDLGDGFNPTYAVAYLIGQPELTLDHPGPKPEGPGAPPHLQYETKRGNILIMGGDQVYPTPGADGYAQRLIGPFRAARSYVAHNPPSVYAIPGNHDWYDGLSAFLKLFCQPDRWIGAWQTQQQRSYFAIKLPYNWWLWGIDIQLCAEIDYPQQQYFEQVAQQARQEAVAAGAEARIILCTAEPAWVYPSYKRNKLPLKNLEIFCQRYIRDYGLKLAATLTGDLHHYASYQGVEDGDWKITAGGGGAFTHPTHQLPEDITLEDVAGDAEKLKDYKRTYRGRAFFPGRKESRRMAFRTLGFPIDNRSFTALLAGLFALFDWSLHAGTWLSVLLLAGGYWAGLFLFADTTVKKRTQARWAGRLHATLQVALLVGAGWFINEQVKVEDPASVLSVLAALGKGLLWSAFGGGLGSLLMGLYLIACTRLIGNHETEAFSAFRGEGYKNFLRLHLTRERLTIYPVGLRNVPTGKEWQYRPNVGDGSPWYEPTAPLQPELIQAPIHIPNDKPDPAAPSARSQFERV